MAADDVTAAQALGDTGKKKKKKKFRFGKKKKTGGKPKADSPDNTGPDSASADPGPDSTGTDPGTDGTNADPPAGT